MTRTVVCQAFAWPTCSSLNFYLVSDATKVGVASEGRDTDGGCPPCGRTQSDRPYQHRYRRVVWIGCRALGPLRSTSTGHRLPPFTLGSGALRRLDRLPGSRPTSEYVHWSSPASFHTRVWRVASSGSVAGLSRPTSEYVHCSSPASFHTRVWRVASSGSVAGLSRPTSEYVHWSSPASFHARVWRVASSGSVAGLSRPTSGLSRPTSEYVHWSSPASFHTRVWRVASSGSVAGLFSLGPLRSTSTGHRLPPFTLGSGALRRLDRLPGSRPTSEYVHWSSPASFHTRVWRVASSGSVGGLSRPTSEYVHWSSPASFHTRVWRVASSGSVAGLSRPTSEYVHWSSPASFRPPSCRETSVQVGRHVCPVGTTSVCTGEEKRNDRAPGALLSRLQVSPNPQPVSNHRYPPDQVK